MSVRDLADVENQKVTSASQASAGLATSTSARVKALQQAVDGLDASMQELQTEEAKYALVFSANRDLETRRGIDATAVAYMLGKIYLTDQDGLSAAVKDQFAASEAALTQLAAQVADSWKQIATLQGQIDAYAHKTAFAAVDANFVAALAGQVPGAQDDIDSVLAKAKQLNQRLDDAASMGIDISKTQGGGEIRASLTDVIGLLQQVSDKKGNK
jgi:hypothetical protein